MMRTVLVCQLAALLAGSALATTLSSVHAQQHSSPRRIGFLLVAVSPDSKEVQAFRQGLEEAGYAEGRDVSFEWRSAEGDYSRIPKLAAELVQNKMEVIVVDSTATAQAAKRATSTIPIVMAVAGDPIGSGLVDSLARPGGNVTGLSTMTLDLAAKRLQLLKELTPKLNRIAVLWNPAMPWHVTAIADLKAAAPSLSVDLSFVDVRTPEDFGGAFQAASQGRAQAVLILGSPPLWTHRKALLTLASNARLPVMYGARAFADEGGLMSYGPNFRAMYHRSAAYVDRILKGVKPSELPIEQPSKFELVVNLKTAKALGIAIPDSILVRADDVIR